MYSPPQFDTFIDLSMKHEDEIILWNGRGRPMHAERVPRLPYTAFSINKQIKEDQLTAGKRRGRGRASIMKTSPQKTDTRSFSSRDSFGFESGRVGLVTNSSQEDTLGCFDNHDNYIEEAGYCRGQEDFPILKGERCNAMVRALQRQKERQNHKANFAKINREMLKDIAGSFENNKLYHKPARVLSLTKANLEKHARDTDEALRISKARSFVNSDSDAPIYEQYGVTHEDIWAYKHNSFKMPQKVKDEVKQFTDCKLSTATYDKGILITDDNIQEDKYDVTESEHQKQVNFLTQLYDEDYWSNEKELSDCTFNRLNDGNTVDVKDQLDNTMSPKPRTGEQLGGDDDFDALSLNDECDSMDGSSELDEFYFFGEGDGPCIEHEASDIPAEIENEASDIPAEIEHEASDIPAEIENEASDIPAEIENEASDNPAERMSTCVKSSRLNTVMATEITEKDQENGHINSIKKEKIDIVTSDISKLKVDQPESSENIIPINTSLANEPPSVSQVKERVGGEIELTAPTECDKPISTTAHLEEIDMSVCHRNADVEKEGIVDNDMEGFQVVKKKRSKKKSGVSPKQTKFAVKSDDTIWKLYGKDVIQVDGLPPSYDMTSLYSMVNGFGNVLDFQARNIDGVCSVRFRLPDEDSCEYAVLCLDKTELFADEGCVLSCFKLSN